MRLNAHRHWRPIISAGAYLGGANARPERVGALPGASANIDLYVGNFFGSNSNILRYDGNTGAFVTNFVPNDSFPLGAAFGPDGNFYATNSNTDGGGK